MSDRKITVEHDFSGLWTLLFVLLIGWAFTTDAGNRLLCNGLKVCPKPYHQSFAACIRAGYLLEKDCPRIPTPEAQ